MGYLSAAGVLNVCIFKADDGGCLFRIACDLRTLPMAAARIVSVQWTSDRRRAVKTLRDARRIAGDKPDEATATAALSTAAVRNGLHLTPHDRVMERAAQAARRLDAALTNAEENGTLRLFNSEYRDRRKQAAQQGKGFMSYAAARRRFRSAIIRRLISPGGSDLFSEVFRGDGG
jgi:hypothetical protein